MNCLMNPNGDDDQLSFDLGRDEFQVWISGVSEAREALGPDQLHPTTGLDWEQSIQLSSTLRAVRDASNGPSIRVVLDADTVRALCLCLRAAMADLGKVDFETRVGLGCEFAVDVRSHLEMIVSHLPGEDGQSPSISDINE